MAQSAAVDVATYIEMQPTEWRPTLEKLRALCRQHLNGYTEVMQYGMPGYERNGQGDVGFAKQARYLSLYILKKPVLDAHRGELAGLDVGKGCVRFPRPNQIDWDVVTTLLTETASSDSDIC